MIILNTNDWGDTMSNRKKKLKIFISYSHKNIKYKEKLLTSLEALRQSYEIEAWHDGMIDAGGNIDENIKCALNTSDLILLLITDNYLASYYCMKKELSEAIEREKNNECKVIPVMFQETVLSDTLSFFGHNRVPEDGKPIATGFKNQSLGCTHAVKMIQKMIDNNFPKCKKAFSQKVTHNTTSSKSKMKSDLCIELYKNGKLSSVPINQEFLDLLPKYHQCILSFSTIMDQSLLEAKKRYSQCYKKYKGAIIPDKEKLQQFRLFLMDICAYTKTYITEPTGIKVHFRISKERNYIGIIAATDEDITTDLASDWATKMTPIPIYNGLVYYSSRLNAPLIKSLNQNLNFKCKNNNVWKDYMTFTFPNVGTGQAPLISYCISIHKDYYKVKANMLRILTYLNFGNVVEKYIIEYCKICKKIDKTFNLVEIIKSL